VPILDKKGRIISVLAGSPRSEGWNSLNLRVTKLMTGVSKSNLFSRTMGVHRRGRYSFLAVGISFGGGQTVGPLLQNCCKETPS
jgi:hypothetical protein